jgi:hypothetical protein
MGRYVYTVIGVGELGMKVPDSYLSKMQNNVDMFLQIRRPYNVGALSI